LSFSTTGGVAKIAGCELASGVSRDVASRGEAGGAHEDARCVCEDGRDDAASTVGAAFGIPGALGAQEGGLVAICAIFGLPAQVAVAMSLIKRVPDIVFGAPSLLGWQVLEGRALLARDVSVQGYQGK